MINDNAKKTKAKGGFLTAGILAAAGIIYIFSGIKVDPNVKNYGIMMWWTGALAIFIRSFFPPLDFKSGFITVVGGFSLTTTLMAFSAAKNLIILCPHLVFTILFLYAGFKYPKQQKKNNGDA